MVLLVCRGVSVGERASYAKAGGIERERGCVGESDRSEQQNLLMHVREE